MKKITTSLLIVLFTAFSVYSQTDGTLTFTFTPVTQSPCYTASRNVMAVWIQSSTGGFIKTKLRRVGAVTADHLPTWAVNSGGPASNALSTSCNTVDATTGATLTSFTAKTITWDGKNTSSVTVPDGTYKITIQETWNHGSASTVTKSYTFTKGPNADNQTPADDTHFTAVTLNWVPAGLGTKQIEDEQNVSISPNPSYDGMFSVNYETANKITVTNIFGSVLFEETVDETIAGSMTIDLHNFPNGIYFVTIFNREKSIQKKLVLSK